MAVQQLQVWTNEITNDLVTFNTPGTNELNIIELSINLKSGAGRFYGLLPLDSLGPTYASPNYINLTIGQPVTITSNYNFPLGTVVVDSTAGGVIQVIATKVGNI